MDVSVVRLFAKDSVSYLTVRITAGDRIVVGDVIYDSEKQRVNLLRGEAAGLAAALDNLDREVARRALRIVAQVASYM